MDTILSILPTSLKAIMQNLPNATKDILEEIRIREKRPLEIIFRGGYAFVGAKSQLYREPGSAYVTSREECAAVLELATHHSVYTFDEELRRGYITISGGHRVGLAGRTVLEQGKVKQIKEVSGFNIRIAREAAGSGSKVLPLITDHEAHSVLPTLIISPPQQGKTTLLRDLTRLISSGIWPSPLWAGLGLKVGIVDERSELAACSHGVPTFDVGPRTDVLDGCPKAEGMMMMIRSMSPDIIAVDEIGRPEDAEAIHEAVRAGIRVMATAHGRDLADVSRRPILKQLIQDGVFQRYVVLSRRAGPGTVEFVCGGNGEPIQQRGGAAVRIGGTDRC
ncbi:stage III sporulation protein AA [Paenibacillus thalictri]|uniref:stage III sporulation protein AA n=1 Tax=Paenibacillus thalictri TaxID=2527873 RepID=UPI0023EA4CB4|nr:stage III sporulation protein AA [Paenibacillus thalictri]